MKIITIAFIETQEDIKKEYHNGVAMGQIRKKHLTCKIPDGIDAIFCGGVGDVQDIINKLSKDLPDAKYYRMTNLEK